MLIAVIVKSLSAHCPSGSDMSLNSLYWYMDAIPFTARAKDHGRALSVWAHWRTSYIVLYHDFTSRPEHPPTQIPLRIGRGGDIMASGAAQEYALCP